MDADLAEGRAEGRAVVEREAAMLGAAVEVGLVAAAMVEVAKEAVVTVVAAQPPSAQRPQPARLREPSPRQSRRGSLTVGWYR
jgi:hypothetical protein